MVIDQNMF